MEKGYVILNKETFDTCNLRPLGFFRYATIVEGNIVDFEITNMKDRNTVGLIFDSKKSAEIFASAFQKDQCNPDDFYDRRESIELDYSTMEPDLLLHILYLRAIAKNIFITNINFEENKIYDDDGCFELVFGENRYMLAHTAGDVTKLLSVAEV